MNTIKENNILISKYDGKKVLKASEISVVTEINDSASDLLEHSKQDKMNNVTGSASMTELDTIKPKFCCTFCDIIIKPKEHGLYLCCWDSFIESNILKKIM